MWANLLQHLTEVIVDERVEINKLFQEYELATVSLL